MGAKIYKNGQWITVSGTPVYVKDAKIEDNVLILTKKKNGIEETIRFRGGESGSIETVSATATFISDEEAIGQFDADSLAKLKASETAIIVLSATVPGSTTHVKFVSGQYASQMESGTEYYRLYAAIIEGMITEAIINMLTGQFSLKLAGDTSLLKHYYDDGDSYIFEDKDLIYYSNSTCEKFDIHNAIFIRDISEAINIDYYYLEGHGVESGEGIYIHGNRDAYDTLDVEFLDHIPQTWEVQRDKVYVDINSPLMIYDPVFPTVIKALSEMSSVSASITGTSTKFIKYITIDGTEYRIAGGSESGTVTDVLVDGSSVVQYGIANIDLSGKANRQALENEILARESGDNLLESGLEAEIERAEEAESGLEAAILNEATLRVNADTTLQTQIFEEKARATQVELSLESGLDKEILDRESGDNDLYNYFFNVTERETAARESGDLLLQQGLEYLNNKVVKKVGFNGNVYTPVNGLVNLGDAASQYDLDDEIERAMTAESGIIEALDTERNIRELADQNLQDLIDTKQDILEAYLKSASVSGNTLDIRNKDGVLIAYTPTFPAVMKIKGTRLQADLPATGQIEGDTYLLSDQIPSPYTGQMAIWIYESGESGIGNWGYTSASIQVDATITESGINPVEGRAIYRALSEKVDTPIYNRKIAELESGIAKKQNKLIAGEGISLEESGDQTVIKSTGSGIGNPDDTTIFINKNDELETSIGGAYRFYNEQAVFTGVKRGIILNAHEAVFRNPESELEEDNIITHGYLEVTIPGFGSLSYTLATARITELYFKVAGETTPRQCLGVDYGKIEELGNIRIFVGLYLNELGNVVFGALLDQDLPTTDIEITIEDVVQANVYCKKMHSSDVLNFDKETFDVDCVGRLKIIKDFIEADHSVTANDKVYAKKADGTATILKDFPELEVATVPETEEYLMGAVEYLITGKIVNGALTGDTLIYKESTSTVNIVPETGYIPPVDVADIIVINASIVSYNPDNGKLKLNNPTNDVIVIAMCPDAPIPPQPGYSITVDVTNGSYTGDTEIREGETASVSILPATGYSCGLVSVTGASYSYDNTTGIITLSEPVSNITITTECLAPLCFTAADPNSSVRYSITGAISANLEFSTDGEVWQSWDTTPRTLVNIGDKVYVRNTENSLSTSTTNFLQFGMTGVIKASGNINSLVNYGNLSSHCYNQLFGNCTSLIEPPELPATTLAEACYARMFTGCRNLTIAPELPATTLANSCYFDMFYTCSSLTTAPELPATTLAPSCYNAMFADCIGLTTAPALPAEDLATYCYANMFSGCSGLTTPPELPATVLVNSCYNSMFFGCANLKITNDGSSGLGIEFFTCPSTTGVMDPVAYMFNGTAGSYQADPVAGETYYWYTE